MQPSAFSYTVMPTPIFTTDAKTYEVDSTSYSSGQTIVEYSYDYESENGSMSAILNGGAGGGLEPALTSATSSYRNDEFANDISGMTGTIMVDWPYYAQASGFKYDLPIAIYYQFTIQGMGRISIGLHDEDNGYYTYSYVMLANGLCQEYLNGNLQESFFTSSGTWSETGTHVISAHSNQWFVLDLMAESTAIPNGSAYAAIDPYLHYDFTWPYGDWDNWTLDTINGLEDYTLVTPIQGSALIAPVPIPSAAWLFCTGLIGIFGIRRKFKK